ncbi:MAG: hypothetical protein GY811_01350 [Myxococcales bacterium]|nr:hypothetical protein [Myxococcales bacterium]
MSNTKNNIILPLLFATAAACGGSGSTTKAESTNALAQPEAAATEALPKAEEILERAIEESGGRAAYAAVKSFNVSGTFAIPAQKMQGALSILGASGGRLRFELEIPGMGTERSGSDGSTVWSMSAMTGSRILEGAERERMLRDADLLKELKWREYYKSANTTGVEDVEGKPAFTVEMVDNVDLSETRFYDKESGLLVRQTGIVKTQMGEMKNDMHFRDYMDFDGMLMPSVVEIEVMGMTQVMTTTSIEINVETTDESFALPEEIKKLAEAAK